MHFVRQYKIRKSYKTSEVRVIKCYFDLKKKSTF